MAKRTTTPRSASAKKPELTVVYFQIPTCFLTKLHEVRLKVDRSVNKAVILLLRAAIEKKRGKTGFPVIERVEDEEYLFVRVPRELIAEIDVIAAEYERPRNRMVRYMLCSELGESR